MFDVVVDRAILYKTDSLIDQKLCDNVISSSAENFLQILSSGRC